MENKEQVNRICLRVFTEIFASISHDLKNCLAIIGENAGLLDDYLVMGNSDTIQGALVSNGTQAINKQVLRSTSILNNMSAFAHSADHETSPVGIKDMLTLCTEISHRQAANNSILVVVDCAEDSTLHTQASVVESLILLVLKSLYQSCPEQSRLVLHTEVCDQGIKIFFQPSSTVEGLGQQEKDIHTLVHHLGAQFQQVNEGFVLRLNSGK